MCGLMYRTIPEFILKEGGKIRKFGVTSRKSQQAPPETTFSVPLYRKGFEYVKGYKLA